MMASWPQTRGETESGQSIVLHTLGLNFRLRLQSLMVVMGTVAAGSEGEIKEVNNAEGQHDGTDETDCSLSYRSNAQVSIKQFGQHRGIFILPSPSRRLQYHTSNI